MKVEDNVIIHEAEEYVSNTKTVEETAADLGISKRTLQLHLKRLEQIDENLYKKVQEKQECAQQAGRVKGGQIGKSHSHYTKAQAEEIARTMIASNLSYNDASARFDIPKSTIYEILHSDLISEDIRKELDILAEANIHDISSEELLRRKRK